MITETLSDYFRTDDFSVTVTMSGGGGYTIGGILEVPYQGALGDETEARPATFTADTASFTSVAEGDTLAYSGTVWTVQDIRIDSTGITHLTLEHTSGTLPSGPVMGMSEDLGWLSDTTRFAEAVTMSGGAGYTVNGIFEKPYAEPSLSDLVSAEAYRATFTCRTADLTSIAEDDTLTLSDSTIYDVKDHRPDGTGISRLILHLAAASALTGDEGQTLSGDEGQTLFGDA